MKQIWDISPEISTGGLLFPGDEPYRLNWTSEFSKGNPLNLCSITLSPHIGAHADAPLHYAENGKSFSELDILPYIGICRVIHAVEYRLLLEVMHLQNIPLPLPERILIRTYRQQPSAWDQGFKAIAPDAITWLHKQGVKLIGIDTPSIDPADSKTLPCHKLLNAYDMRVLENLNLEAIPEGDYELIALPLKLDGACASPVRAVLRSL
ncbi:MAG: arylformamidase [Holophagaceae bacterium]|nr:arylformamidase [Holophagaceae bacterium]